MRLILGLPGWFKLNTFAVSGVWHRFGSPTPAFTMHSARICREFVLGVNFLEPRQSVVGTGGEIGNSLNNLC